MKYLFLIGLFIFMGCLKDSTNQINDNQNNGNESLINEFNLKEGQTVLRTYRSISSDPEYLEKKRITIDSIIGDDVYITEIRERELFHPVGTLRTLDTLSTIRFNAAIINFDSSLDYTHEIIGGASKMDYVSIYNTNKFFHIKNFTFLEKNFPIVYGKCNGNLSEAHIYCAYIDTLGYYIGEQEFSILNNFGNEIIFEE